MRVHQRAREATFGFFATVIFILLAVSPVASAQQTKSSPLPNPNAVSINTDLVSLTVTVTDERGRFVSGLSKDDFEVFEDQVKQEISHFSDTDAPLSVAVIFDLSGSMSEKKMERAREALKRFIQTSHEQDEYSLVGFNEQPQLLLDRACDGDALLQRLRGMRASGRTALYDAVALGLERVSKGFYPKRALVVISDGEDNRSRVTFDHLRRMLRESDAIIYAVGIGGYELPRQMGEANLKQLAEASGGRAFFPKGEEKMDEAFEQIALELRSQYSIGYAPSNFIADGKWRRVKVRLTQAPDARRLKVRSRAGYYAAPGRAGLPQASPE
jgi:Ca-activated chloride channel family protein